MGTHISVPCAHLHTCLCVGTLICVSNCAVVGFAKLKLNAYMLTIFSNARKFEKHMVKIYLQFSLKLNQQEPMIHSSVSLFQPAQIIKGLGLHLSLNITGYLHCTILICNRSVHLWSCGTIIIVAIFIFKGFTSSKCIIKFVIRFRIFEFTLYDQRFRCF